MQAELPPEPPPPAERPVRYGSAMLREFGWLYTLLGLGVVMERVRFEDHSVENIRTAAAKGPIVYALLRQSELDHLAFNAVLNRRHLPLSVWADGLSNRRWQPTMERWRDTFRRLTTRWTAGRAPDPVASGWISRQVSLGQPVTLFLEPDHGLPADRDPFQAVLDAQQNTERPIQIVPVICVWDRAPEGPQTLVRDFLLGNREAPTEITKVGALYLPWLPQPFLQVGDPLDVSELIRRVRPERQCDAVRTILRRFLKRESSVVRGPRLLPRREMESLVLDAPPMRRFAEEEAAAQGRSVESVRKEMHKEFNSIAANFSFGVIRFLSIACRPLWTRVFNGYDIRDEDLEKIRNAMRSGTAVLVPCHKSHFDYLLMSWVLYWQDLIVPHVVAGINLAIWPVSILLRGAGGFFIKRKFAGERIHARVFSRYLRELLFHGYIVEFFIEGGRTRTGSLLPPKLGVLEMVIEAAHNAPPGHEITLLPVSIAYEQVAEEGAYEKELRGKEKKAESVGDLVAASSVLSRRFGRIYLRVGDPISASWVAHEGWDKDVAEATKRDVLRRTGERLVHRIGSVMVVLPTSLVALGLLAHHRQAITHDDLMARVRRWHDWLDRRRAPIADSLEHFDSGVAQALHRLLRGGRVRSLGEGHERVWDIVPDQRVLLDFHKNQILHYLAPAGLATLAIRALGRDTFTRDELTDGFESAARWCRREFILDPDTGRDRILDDALGDLVDHGALARTDDGYAVASPERIGEVHALLRSHVEAYRVVAAFVGRMDARRVDQKALLKEVLATRDAALSQGLATRPESFGAVTLGNAIAVMIEEGALRKDADGKLVADLTRAAPCLAELAAMVDG